MHPLGAPLSQRCGRPVGAGFSAVSQMASPLSPCRRQQAQALSRCALKARNALVLEHLPLADAIATATARRLFPLVEREDLVQVAREALVRSAPAAGPASLQLPTCAAASLGPYSITCAIGFGWCAFPIACMSRASARWGTPASMPRLMASTPCSISWRRPQPSWPQAVMPRSWP